MRIYGKVKVLWQAEDHKDAYLEVAYKEYREDGSLKATGTEDFSVKRWSKTPIRFVYTWDGERRNKGGKRWFDYEGAYRIDNPKGLKGYFKAIRPEAEIVEVRTR